MAAELLVKDTLPDSTAPSMAIISHYKAIRQLIAFIAQTQGADIGIVSVSGCILNDDPLDAFYDSPNQIFAFLKFARRSLVSKRDSMLESDNVVQIPLAICTITFVRHFINTGISGRSHCRENAQFGWKTESAYSG
jgi:hypothetical protein